MDIKNYKKIVPFLMKSKIVPMVWGRHGIGKTEIHRQIANELGYNFIYLTFGAVEDVGDIIGLQDFVESPAGRQTMHAMPAWFPTKPGNIILIDEFNRANKAVLQAMYPFILEGRLHTHKLPEDTYIMLAANPPTDEYNTTDVTDAALMSRMAHFNLKPSLDEWLEYCRKTEVRGEIVNFISTEPSMLEHSGEKFDLDFVKPDRRSYFSLSRFLNVCNDKELIQQVSYALLGEVAATRFIASHDKYAEFIKAESILKGLNEVESLKLKELTKLDRVDSLNSSLEDVFFILNKKKKISDKELINIKHFVLNIPKDLGFKAVRELLRMNFGKTQEIIGEDKDLIDYYIQIKHNMNEEK